MVKRPTLNDAINSICQLLFGYTSSGAKGKLSTIDESSSNSIGVVQPQNSQIRKPKPLRERSPLELIAKGYTVIDSQASFEVLQDQSRREARRTAGNTIVSSLPLSYRTCEQQLTFSSNMGSPANTANLHK